MYRLDPRSLDGPLEWLMEWRTTIIIVAALLLAWGMWWSDSMRSTVNTERRRQRAVRRAQEEDIEYQEAIIRARDSIDAVMQKPLSLEEETVAIHNIRVAESHATDGSMH